VVLNRLDWFLHGQGHHGQACDNAQRSGRPNVRFVRYADDWCVFITRGSKQYAEKLRDRIRELLDRDCGVRLSDEKTRITHVRDGFDFLGFRMTLSVGKGGTLVPKIKVPRKATIRIVQRLKEVMRYRPLQESGAVRIVRGSAVIRGWSNYFRIAHNFSQAANTLDHQAFWIATKALCRKFDLTTANCLQRYRFGSAIGINESCMLMRAQEVKMVSRLHPPKLYRPGTGCYLEDLDWEVDFRLLESGRPGRMDTKALALFRDGNRCRKCGVRVTYGNSEADHIVPVNRFASFQQANVPMNVQILCLACHKDKTAASR
jgi:5-methylcytosine-specific restriction endonuclease McrA